MAEVAGHEVRGSLVRQRAGLELEKDLVGDAQRQSGERLGVFDGQRGLEARLAPGEQRSRDGDDHDATVERAARRDQPDAGSAPLDGRDRAVEDDIEAVGRAGHDGAQALDHRPVDVGILGGGEVDRREVRRVDAHHPAHGGVEERPGL